MTLKQRVLSFIARKIQPVQPKSFDLAAASRQFPSFRLMTTPQRKTTRQSQTNVGKLRRFSETIPVRRAIKRIKRGILGLRWQIVSDDQFHEEASPSSAIYNSILLPWPGLSFNDVMGAVIEDIIVLGFAAIYREKGSGPSYFFFRDLDAGRIGKNLDWKPGSNSPRYILLDSSHAGKPLYDHEVFLLEYERNSHKDWPVSPVDTAMTMIESWLGLLDWQDTTTSQAHQEYILNLRGMDRANLELFRQYWQTEVVRGGRQAIVSVDGIESVKVGAKTDNELYLKYQERITSFLALAFDLPRQDFNLEADVNRSTAQVNADSVFDQVIRPLALFLEEKLNLELLRFYAPGFHFEFVDVDPRRDLQETQRTALIWRYGGMSYNEFRNYNGLPAIPGWDNVLMVPANFILIRRNEDSTVTILTPSSNAGQPAPKEKT
ncbi:MAG: phage portal protein [bacterium JZ-2024 1]